MKNHKGRNSLIFAITGLIVVQTLIYLKYLDGYWHIVLAGFEAGTVGGIADWFAVKALFREIPIPFVRKHTNIIVKNRVKISDGIVDLITNEWLSPQLIKEKVSEVKITEKLLNLANNNQQVVSFLKQLLMKFVSHLENEKTHTFLSKIVINQFQKLKVGVFLGNSLNNFVEKESYQQLWALGLNSVHKIINSKETKVTLKETIKSQVANYKKESSLKSLLVTLGEGYNVIDHDSIADKLINTFNEVIEKTQTDPDYILRKNIDNQLILFATRLMNEEPKTTEMINDLKNKLVSDSTIRTIVNVLVSNLKEAVEDTSKLDLFLEKQYQHYFKILKENKTLQEKIDNFLKRTIEKLITENHHEIGKMVGENLANLDNEALVTQIEDKVGNDLQYIRLNGAIVGGCVGIIIALLRYLLF